MADVFISYARSDKARVAPLVAAVQAQGWSVWWDPEISPGQEFDDQIEAEIKAAKAMLVVWTPVSVVSRWVRGEAREAAELGILVPVRFDAARLPIDVRAIHTTDLDNWGDDPGSPPFQEFLRALAAMIARSDARSRDAMEASAAPAAPCGPARIAICVLPFANMSGDAEQQYFSDGISEDIITELSRWRMLEVRSRAASFRYHGVAVDVQQVARELRVRFIVEGSVRRMGDRLRITAQLIDAESGSHVWAEKFDRALAELFTVQDQLVQTIVSTLVGRVHTRDAERASRKPPSSLAAYECVLKGNALSWDEPAAAAEATRLFEQAVALDPGFGLAHALVASMRCCQWYDDRVGSDAMLQEAFALATRAVELEPDEGTCHSILAQIHHLRHEYGMCLQHMRRAVELNPNNQWCNADMGTMLNYAGEPEQALTWFKRALEIDPFFDPPWYWREYGLAYLLLERHDEAVAMLNHLPTGQYRIAALRAACHGLRGDTDQARFYAAECLGLRPQFTTTHFISKMPFKNPAHAALVASGLKLAGLPE